MKSKAILGLFAFAVVSFGIAAMSAQPVSADNNPNNDEEKVWICHSRQPQPSNGNGVGGRNNPYGPKAIEVSKSAVFKEGHDGHDGEIFDATDNTQNYWGDIIPSFTYIEKGVTKTYPGMNLTEGQAWLDNNCQKPGTSSVNFCDPSQIPRGSVAQWLQANKLSGADCFDYSVSNICGQLDVQFTRNDTPYEYQFRYVIGSEMPTNWEGDGILPVEFDEDEFDGSVEVTYYAVGPEKDYFIGFGIPNFWDGGKTVAVNTNCEGGSGNYIPPKTPKTPAAPETPKTPVTTAEVEVAELPNTAGSMTNVIAIAAVSLVSLLAAGYVIKSRLLNS